MLTKVKIHEFDPVIYPRKLWIVVTDNPQILSDHFDYVDSEDSPFDSSHDFKKYVIIDDDSDMLYWQKDNFILSDRFVGLTKGVVFQAKKILNRYD